MQPSELTTSFAYRAQTIVGDPMSGTVEAISLDDANRRLKLMQLRVVEIEPAWPIARPRALRGNDFLAFNTQLAHLTGAGLPVEQGLRLIAEEMGSPRLAETVRQIAKELEAGKSLPQVFEEHSAEFPPLYSELVHAGIRTGSLSAMLFNLGRHIELVTRLRSALWKSLSYPLMIFASTVIMLIFLGMYVFPQFSLIFRDFRTQLPGITMVALSASGFLLATWPALLAIVTTIVIGFAIVWRMLSGLGRQRIIETFIFPLPALGPALRRNLLARWCDALRLGVEAGVDLPTALTLAGQAVASPALIGDGAMLLQAMQAGRPLDEGLRMRLVPPTLTTVLTLSSSGDDLPAALETLGQMFQQQAEQKMAMIPAILAPAMTIGLALVIGFIVIALFAPIISLIQAVSGPTSHSWFH